jgi:hypothetical protein
VVSLVSEREVSVVSVTVTSVSVKESEKADVSSVSETGVHPQSKIHTSAVKSEMIFFIKSPFFACHTQSTRLFGKEQRKMRRQTVSRFQAERFA